MIFCLLKTTSITFFKKLKDQKVHLDLLKVLPDNHNLKEETDEENDELLG